MGFPSFCTRCASSDNSLDQSQRLTTWHWDMALSSWASPQLIIQLSLSRQLKVSFICRSSVLQAHLAPENQTGFDFRNYICRSLEEDFKVVVGIRFILSTPPKFIVILSYPIRSIMQLKFQPCIRSPTLWFTAVLFLLSNTHGKFGFKHMANRSKKISAEDDTSIIP